MKVLHLKVESLVSTTARGGREGTGPRNRRVRGVDRKSAGDQLCFTKPSGKAASMQMLLKGEAFSLQWVKSGEGKAEQAGNGNSNSQAERLKQAQPWINQLLSYEPTADE